MFFSIIKGLLHAERELSDCCDVGHDNDISLHILFYNRSFHIRNWYSVLSTGTGTQVGGIS